MQSKRLRVTKQVPEHRRARRFDEQRQEYVNDALGVGYPVVSGVPILIPRKARMLAESPAGALSTTRQLQ